MTGSLFSTPGSLRPLRSHQERALEMLRRSVATGHKRPMLQAPTGFGKTLVAAHIIQRALDKGNRIIFTVPALSLIDQTVAAFAAEGIESVGVMQGYHPATDATQPVQICSVQTLARRQKPDAAIVIIDEAHLDFKAVREWMADSAWATVPFIGLSATPWTRGLGRHYDDLLVPTSTKGLIDLGYLSPFTVFAPSEPDLSEVRTVAGDFHEGELSGACDTPKLVGDVIETWRERGENRSTLCYAIDCAHAQHLLQRFLEVGVAAEYMDAYTELADRERIFERFRRGATRVLSNVSTLTVGIDLDVRCIVDARPTKSEMRYVQVFGRGLRTAEGKDKLIVLDHSGNALRLGLPTEIHHDRLDDGAPRKAGGDREREARLPRRCETCTAIMPRGVLTCTACGAMCEANTSVETVDGRLVEIGSGKSSRVEPTMADKAQWFSELKGFGQIKGYASGWASHKFREKFGVWPSPSISCVYAVPPSLKVRQWITSRAIAFAKGRARA